MVCRLGALSLGSGDSAGTRHLPPPAYSAPALSPSTLPLWLSLNVEFREHSMGSKRPINYSSGCLGGREPERRERRKQKMGRNLDEHS